MLSQIRVGVENEDDNPTWVHGVCANAYPYIFKMVTVDPQTDAFTLSTDCSGTNYSGLINVDLFK